MKKKYIQPKSEIYNIVPETIIVQSSYLPPDLNDRPDKPNPPDPWHNPDDRHKIWNNQW